MASLGELPTKAALVFSLDILINLQSKYLYTLQDLNPNIQLTNKHLLTQEDMTQ